jgi:hypothetical protein
MNNALKVPTAGTLNKYGLTAEDFKRIVSEQGGVCPICEKTPSTGRWNIDHYHIKGWKKLPPEKRKLYVRGVVCWFCNRYYMSKAITPRKAENIRRYLDDFLSRIN